MNKLIRLAMVSILLLISSNAYSLFGSCQSPCLTIQVSNDTKGTTTSDMYFAVSNITAPDNTPATPRGTTVSPGQANNAFYLLSNYNKGAVSVTINAYTSENSSRPVCEFIAGFQEAKLEQKQVVPTPPYDCRAEYTKSASSDDGILNFMVVSAP